MKKSKFNLSYLNSTTGNAGYLIPFLLQPTLPNDTFRISLTSFIRAQPMLAPLMHEVKFFTQYWFVPYRIIWDEWEDFITGGGDLTFAPEVPSLPDGTQFKVGSLGDYFGYPIGVDCGGVSILPFRAYNEIWNTRYRDEDLQNDLNISYRSGSDSLTSLILQSPSWKRDYFTTARPFTQRGPIISVPVYTDVPTEDTRSAICEVYKFSPTGDFSLVFVNKQINSSQFLELCQKISSVSPASFPVLASPGSFFWLDCPLTDVADLKVLMHCTNVQSGAFSKNSLVILGNGGGSSCNNPSPRYVNASAQFGDFSGFGVGFTPGKTTGIEMFCGGSSSSGQFEFILNQPGQIAGSVNIRDLRASSALQRYGERSLQWGNRYEEFIAREFGIKPRDSRIQRPEYLGGGKGTLQISEVLQTAEGADTGVGTMRGHGVAGIGQRPIKFRCPEHGLIIGLLSIRPVPVYTQGINREFLKRSRLDFFTPELANIGMQEVLQRELYVTKDNAGVIFGYSDRYQEYRYNMPKVTGEFRTTLDFWNMARQFEQAPVLNDSFIRMSNSESAFYRPFASQTAHQFLMMLRNNIRAYRPIPKRAKNILK